MPFSVFGSLYLNIYFTFYIGFDSDSSDRRIRLEFLFKIVLYLPSLECFYSGIKVLKFIGKDLTNVDLFALSYKIYLSSSVIIFLLGK